MKAFDMTSDNSQLSKDVDRLEEDVYAAQCHLERIIRQRDALTVHESQLTRKTDSLAGAVARVGETLTQHKQSLDKTSEQFDQALSEVDQTLSRLNQLMAPNPSLPLKKEEQIPEEPDHNAVHVSDLREYFAADDQFLRQFNRFHHRQFHEGLLAQATAETGDNDVTSLLTVDDASRFLIKGESSTQYLQICKELSRLQSIYATSERERLCAELALARTKALQDTLRSQIIREGRDRFIETQALRQKAADVLAEMDHAQAQTRSLHTDSLESVLKELGELQATSVLHGDYDLKIARQEYHLSRLRKVIAELAGQQARHCLLHMCFENQMQQNSKLFEFISSLNQELTRWADLCEQRMTMMNRLLSVSHNPPRQTIDERDAFLQDLYQMLNNNDRPLSPKRITSHFVPRSSLVEKAQDVSRFKDDLRKQFDQITERMDSQIRLSRNQIESIQKPLLSETVTAEAILTPQAVAEALQDVESIMQTLESTVVAVDKDIQEKKRIMDRDPEGFAFERNLFVEYFSNPNPRFDQLCRDLESRIEARTISSST
eukprot:GILK01012941.1.p1 GENE.GILK01012941.1~~GILK01012941.1.p1  ORF type:complete len:642 (+),score=147.05 GILK01012941.1:288-1928(+)